MSGRLPHWCALRTWHRPCREALWTTRALSGVFTLSARYNYGCCSNHLHLLQDRRVFSNQWLFEMCSEGSDVSAVLNHSPSSKLIGSARPRRAQSGKQSSRPGQADGMSGLCSIGHGVHDGKHWEPCTLRGVNHCISPPRAACTDIGRSPGLNRTCPRGTPVAPSSRGRPRLRPRPRIAVRSCASDRHRPASDRAFSSCNPAFPERARKRGSCA